MTTYITYYNIYVLMHRCLQINTFWKTTENLVSAYHSNFYAAITIYKIGQFFKYTQYVSTHNSSSQDVKDWDKIIPGKKILLETNHGKRGKDKLTDMLMSE